MFRSAHSSYQPQEFTQPVRFVPAVQKIIFASAIVLFVYYFKALAWTFEEAIHFGLGVSALWAPLALFFFLLLRDEIPDRVVRLTFSCLASYALTTLAYLGIAEAHLDALFDAGQGIIAFVVIIWAIRRKVWRVGPVVLRSAWGHNSTLLFLLAGSLVAGVQYQQAFFVDPNTGTKTFILFQDVMYSSSASYQLARQIPVLQSPTRAGTPERAYHLLSHIATMLLARDTGQTDMLHALTQYHYTVIGILITLALYSIVKTLTSSRWAGYMAASLMYIVVITWPPLAPSRISYLYFTLFPHGINGLDVVTSEPQWYSGLAVMYGALLGVLLIVQHFHMTPDGARRPALLILTGLISATLLRFRVHFGIVMLPGFLIMILWMGLRKRQPLYFLAIGLAGLIGLLLYLETKLPVYLKDTSSVSIAFNSITSAGTFSAAFFNSWPQADLAYNSLSGAIHDPDALKWVWQAISLTAFTFLNIIGIPLCIASLIYFWRKQNRQQFAWFGLYLVGLLVSSLFISIMVDFASDEYSVAGQIVFHVRWYLFPLMAAALWTVYQFVARRWPVPRALWAVAGYAVVVGFLLARPYLPTSSFIHPTTGEPVSDTDQQAAFGYLHDETPQDSVVMASRYVQGYTFPISGIAGRSAYLEAFGNFYDYYAMRLNPADNRLIRIQSLWAATDPQVFCQSLLETPSTLVMDYADNPLKVHDAPCLSKVWTSPKSEIAFWRVVR